MEMASDEEDGDSGEDGIAERMRRAASAVVSTVSWPCVPEGERMDDSGHS